MTRWRQAQSRLPGNGSASASPPAPVPLPKSPPIRGDLGGLGVGWISFVRLSTPMCAFIPKYHWLPLFVCSLPGSGALRWFLVELGAAMMLAFTMVPRFSRSPQGIGLPHRTASPQGCASLSGAGTGKSSFHPGPLRFPGQFPRTAVEMVCRTVRPPAPGPTGHTNAAAGESVAFAPLP